MELKTTLISCCFAVILIFAVSGCIYVFTRGECVTTQPAVCTRGSITNGQSGLLPSGTVEYHLWFGGKNSKTGEDCEKKRRVTESVHDEWMGF